jgi:hemolysin activation/secretion protein
MELMKYTALMAWAWGILTIIPIQAETVSPLVQHEQLEQARQADAAREERLRRPQVQIDGMSERTVSPYIEPGRSSFFIHSIQLQGLVPEFSFLRPLAATASHTDMDIQTIQHLVDTMNQELVNRGYATSRIAVPEQNLKSGVLILAVQPGRIHAVTYSKGSARLPWRTSFPIWEGDILNVRMLEQGLEQMKSLSSQDVSMRIIPSEQAGTSDIELTINRTRPIHYIVSVDNSGLAATGRVQVSTDIAIDNPFYGNDLLHIGMNGDGARDGYERGTRGQRSYYRIPYGKETFSLAYNRYTYHQTVHNVPYDFISSGKSDTSALTWEHLMSRNQYGKISFDVSVRKHNSHNYINDMEIPVQTRHTTTVEAGISEQRYIGSSTFYGRIGHRMGVGWFGAMPENQYEDGPKTRYHMWVLDTAYRHPVTIGHRPAAYTTSFHGQWTTGGDRLYGADMMSLGNRYTVRGFDGEYTLMGESGWYWRNEVSSHLAQWNSDIYTGIDIGAVYGPNTADLAGRAIVGAVIGLRGNFLSGLSYDIFAGIPLYKPDGYHTEHVTSGFTASWRF